MVGIGFDFHLFEEGKKIVLGGVSIPSPYALKGHSDADVIIHAIVDAILGAAGLGDIGDYFPPTDEKWKNAESRFFLKKVLEMITDRGLKIINVDVTYIGEIPRLGNYKKIIADNLSRITGAPVNMKATTMEGAGIIGNREGAAAIAVVQLEAGKNGC